MDCSPPDPSVYGDSPGKNTRMGCHALLPGIIPTQGSNPGLPHCRQILYQLSHKGRPCTAVKPLLFWIMWEWTILDELIFLVLGVFCFPHNPSEVPFPRLGTLQPTGCDYNSYVLLKRQSYRSYQSVAAQLRTSGYSRHSRVPKSHLNMEEFHVSKLESSILNLHSLKTCHPKIIFKSKILLSLSITIKYLYNLALLLPQIQALKCGSTEALLNTCIHKMVFGAN